MSRAESRPRRGEVWRLKSTPYRAATVTAVDDQPNSIFGGSVYIDTPWTRAGKQRKSMDVFLKQYERPSRKEVVGE